MEVLYNSMPSYPHFYKPLLTLLKNGESINRNELFEKTADIVGITLEQRKVIMKKGALLYKDRMAWALTYLKKSGLIFQPQRGYWQITNRGKDFIIKNEAEIIDDKKLTIFPEFKEFIDYKKIDDTKVDLSKNVFEPTTPDETLENIITTNIELLKSDLLDLLKNRDPFLFEYTCKDLLLAMGYAGGIEEFANVTQKSNDGGIDCVIKQDPLGINSIYIQAKRYNGIVNEREIRDFVEALSIRQAQSGVFITTGTYSGKAINSAKQSNCNVILINGKNLVSLMIKYGIGVESKRKIELLKVDEDYFDEE